MPLHPHAEAHVDAVVPVHVGDHGAQHRSDAALQRHGQRLDEGDVDAEPAAGGGHLGPDEPGTDHRDAPG